MVVKGVGVQLQELAVHLVLVELAEQEQVTLMVVLEESVVLAVEMV